VAARRRRFARRNRDLVWITTVIQSSSLETGGAGVDLTDLVLPADWSVTGGFDRCTLMGIRGWLAFNQVASGTSADAPCIALAVYVTSELTTANQMDPLNAADYGGFDVLYTDGMAGVGTISAAGMMARQLDIKARRKLTSAQEVRVCVSIPNDTAAPRFNTIGVFRSLLKLDSQ